MRPNRTPAFPMSARPNEYYSAGIFRPTLLCPLYCAVGGTLPTLIACWVLSSRVFVAHGNFSSGAQPDVHE